MRIGDLLGIFRPRPDNRQSSINPHSPVLNPQLIDNSQSPIPNSPPLRLPIEDSIDLHAFAPRDIPSVVDEYIRATHERGLSEVRLIHGRGKGVQRGIVQAVLEKNPLVEEFWDAPESHLGATVARLVG